MNLCVSLLRKTKKNYFSNLKEENVTDNKLFWKTVKSFLSNKLEYKDKIDLPENGDTVKSQKETTKTLNGFSTNVVKNLFISRIL